MLALDSSASSVDCTASVFGGIGARSGTGAEADVVAVGGAVDPVGWVGIRGSAAASSGSNAEKKNQTRWLFSENSHIFEIMTCAKRDRDYTSREST